MTPKIEKGWLKAGMGLPSIRPGQIVERYSRQRGMVRQAHHERILRAAFKQRILREVLNQRILKAVLKQRILREVINHRFMTVVFKQTKYLGWNWGFIEAHSAP